MQPIRTILCAIDFSPDSRDALRAALALGRRTPVHILALHVVEPLLAEASVAMRMDQSLKGESETALGLFVQAEAKRIAPSASVTTMVRAGTPEREILSCAAERGADLIAVGSRGLGGASRLFFGSVSEKVLRRSELPVLAVPCVDERAPFVPPAGVLAALDVDATAEAGAAAAVDFARLLDLPLRFIHVVPAMPGGWRWTQGREMSAAGRIERARRRLVDVAAALHLQPDIDVRVGSPALTIAEAAGERAGTLIVVGVNAGNPLARLGTTAYRIVCASAVPVVAIPLNASATGPAAPETAAATSA